MNVARQISRRFGRATVARTRSAADYYINTTVSVGSDPFGPGDWLVLRTVDGEKYEV